MYKVWHALEHEVAVKLKIREKNIYQKVYILGTQLLHFVGYLGHICWFWNPCRT